MTLKWAAIVFSIMTVLTGVLGSFQGLDLGFKLILIYFSVAGLPVSITLWILVLVKFISRRKSGH